jgi:4-hydroxythreonine-4-phosphate dehydrogenase
MKFKPILIVAGEPNSIFFEIFLKTIKKNKFRSPIILIASKKILEKHIKYFKYNIRFKEINFKKDIKKIYPDIINLINVEYNQKRIFENISKRSNTYIKKSFDIAIQILMKGITNKFINGPISKKTFLNKNSYGITEYLAQKTNSKNIAMIIYNKSLSVCPLTTHLPIKYITKKITKSAIINKVSIINSFWKEFFNKKPKIAVTGLNPHCESIDIFNEDEKIIMPTIKLLKKKNYDISGPLPADTLFLKDNRKKFDVIIGMYHDQVLTPVKTLFEYDAINVTAGLPFIRVSPDHGPNEQMLGKNKSNHLSILRSIQFLDF